MRIQWTAYRSPNTCAFVERFIQTLGQECFGERHLNYVVREFLEHYRLERPQQSLVNTTVLKTGYRRKATADASAFPLVDVGCKTRLGGLLKHYYRTSA